MTTRSPDFHEIEDRGEKKGAKCGGMIQCPQLHGCGIIAYGGDRVSVPDNEAWRPDRRQERSRLVD